MAYSVCIDIGHGGSDSGAVSGGHVEKTYNLDTGLACGKRLKDYGVTVYYTRTTDKYLSLSDRYNYANSKNVDLFVSIHHNAGGGDRGEVIYSIYEGKGKKLASYIAKEMREDMGQTTVQEYSKKSEKTGKDYYAVIRGSNMPANIVEICFLDNKKDVQIADTLAERQRNGREIADGILKYLGIKVNEGNTETKPQEEKDVKTIVTYLGDADVFAAVIVAQKNKAALMKESDFKSQGVKADKVIKIGGNAADTNRYETFKNAAKLL